MQKSPCWDKSFRVGDIIRRSYYDPENTSLIVEVRHYIILAEDVDNSCYHFLYAVYCFETDEAHNAFLEDTYDVYHEKVA